MPVESGSRPLDEQVQGLFFYALLPLVWLVMAAIINGYELRRPGAPPRRTDVATVDMAQMVV